MSFAFIFFGSLVTAFSGAVAPGPLLAVTLADARKQGPFAGIRLINGHALLEFFLLVLIIYGPGAYLKTQAVLIATGFLGGALLLMMGFELIWKAGSDTSEYRLFSRSSPEIKGALTSISNPYWLLWWVTIGAAFLSRSLVLGLAGAAVFFAGHILADYIWYGAVSFLTVKGNITAKSWYKWVEVVCGLWLVVFALYFLFDAVKRAGLI